MNPMIWNSIKTKKCAVAFIRRDGRPAANVCDAKGSRFLDTGTALAAYGYYDVARIQEDLKADVSYVTLFIKEDIV